MKDLLLFRDGIFISIITWVIIIAVGLGIFYGCDYGFGKSHDEVAAVVDKYHIPAHTDMIYHSNGKGGGYFTTIYYPERWGLKMKWNYDTYDFDCTEYWCNVSQVGKSQPVTIVTGAITGNFYSGHIRQ